MYHLVENLRKISILLNPSLEETSEEILNQLGINQRFLKSWDSIYSYYEIPENVKVIENGKPLFVRLDKDEEVNYIKSLMKGN